MIANSTKLTPDLGGYRPPTRAMDANSWGTTQAAAGIGYEITQPSRYRKGFGLMAGLMAAADRHQNKYTLGRLRELCRAHDRQSTLFSGILDRAIDNIWGSNFDFIPNAGDKDLNLRAKDFIGVRMERQNCDATGVRDFTDTGKTCLRAVWNDGDVLQVKRKDGRLLMFEADQIETPENRSVPDGRRVVLGVQLDSLNRHRGYYVKDRPVSGDYGMVRAGQASRWIPAGHAWMPAYRKRFNQTRGVPVLAAILSFFDRTNNYLDYESLAAEINAMLGWKITKAAADGEPTGSEDNDDTASTYEKLQKMEPGQIFELLTGEDVAMIGSTRPGDNFEPYMVTCCRIIGVGVGLPLELLLLDFSRTNYSSARASLSEARRTFRAWQRFCQVNMALPWYRWQIARGIASGELPADGRLFKARCQWPAWEYIDPVKEAQGNAIAIGTAVKSRSQCIRETGGDPDEVFAEIAAENKKMKELDITLPRTVLKIGTMEKDEEKEEERSDKDTKGR